MSKRNRVGLLLAAVMAVGQCFGAVSALAAPEMRTGAFGAGAVKMAAEATEVTAQEPERTYFTLSEEEKDHLEFMLSGLVLPLEDGTTGSDMAMKEILGTSPVTWPASTLYSVFSRMIRFDMSYGETDDSHLAALGITKSIVGQEAIYPLIGIQALSMSVFGRTMPEPESNGITSARIAENEFFLLLADGDPVPEQVIDTAYIEDGRFFVEGASCLYSNGGDEYRGRFVAEFKPSEQSLLGYTLLSFDRVCGPSYVQGLTASASSTLPTDTVSSYDPALVLDGDVTTAWNEGAAGNGEGQWIQLSSQTEFTFTGVSIANGFQKNDDIYLKNGRPASIRMECSDGSAWMLTNLYGYPYDIIPLGRKITATWVKFTIETVEAGSKYQDTCISEIALFDGNATSDDHTSQSAGTDNPSAPAAPSAPETTPAIPEITLYCCASEYVTLRSEPSRQATALTTIPTRGVATYLGSAGEFYYISYGGQTGYALMDFFSIDPNAPLNYGDGSVTVSSDIVLYCCASEFVTLRSIADRSGADLGHIPSRAAVTYLGAVGEFYYVNYLGTNGYVLQEFFSTNINAPLNYGSGSKTTSTGINLYCRASESATLRATPSREGEELTQIPSRDSALYISSVGEFYLVSYKGQGGYVLKDFFSTDPFAELNYGSGSSTSKGETILYCCASEWATLRSIASRAGESLAQVPSRAAVTYYGTVGEFYYVQYGDQFGYVLRNYFSTDPEAPLNYGN